MGSLALTLLRTRHRTHLFRIKSTLDCRSPRDKIFSSSSSYLLSSPKHQEGCFSSAVPSRSKEYAIFHTAGAPGGLRVLRPLQHLPPNFTWEHLVKATWLLHLSTTCQ